MMMTVADALSWDNIQVGDQVPPLEKRPSPMQLFMFSAVTWNRHLIHYNSEFALNDGLKHIAVHRALIGGFLAQMLTQWVGSAGTVRKVEWSVRNGAAPGELLTCKGRILDKRIEADRRIAECEIWAENESRETIAPGIGIVLFR